MELLTSNIVLNTLSLKEKNALINLFWGNIEKPYTDEMDELLYEARKLHCLKQNSVTTHFNYRGVTYMVTPLAPNRRASPIEVAPLAEDAIPFMDRYLELKEQITEDGSKFAHIFGSILSGVGSSQDIRDLLPDTYVQRYISDTRVLPRSKEISEISFCTSFLLKQYEEIIVPMIDYYIGMELIR